MTSFESKSSNKPKKLYVFCNGDEHTKVKLVRIKPFKYRSFGDLLSELTSSFSNDSRLNYGVRKIFTPSTGRRVRALEEIEEGRNYVCAGYEAFKPLNYGFDFETVWNLASKRVHNYLYRSKQSSDFSSSPSNSIKTSNRKSFTRNKTIKSIKISFKKEKTVNIKDVDVTISKEKDQNLINKRGKNYSEENKENKNTSTPNNSTQDSTLRTARNGPIKNVKANISTESAHHSTVLICSKNQTFSSFIKRACLALNISSPFSLNRLKLSTTNGKQVNSMQDVFSTFSDLELSTDTSPLRSKKTLSTKNNSNFISNKTKKSFIDNNEIKNQLSINQGKGEEDRLEQTFSKRSDSPSKLINKQNQTHEKTTTNNNSDTNLLNEKFSKSIIKSLEKKKSHLAIESLSRNSFSRRAKYSKVSTKSRKSVSREYKEAGTKKSYNKSDVENNASNDEYWENEKNNNEKKVDNRVNKQNAPMDPQKGIVKKINNKNSLTNSNQNIDQTEANKTKVYKKINLILQKETLKKENTLKDLTKTDRVKTMIISLEDLFSYKNSKNLIKDSIDSNSDDELKRLEKQKFLEIKEGVARGSLLIKKNYNVKKLSQHAKHNKQFSKKEPSKKIVDDKDPSDSDEKEKNNIKSSLDAKTNSAQIRRERHEKMTIYKEKKERQVSGLHRIEEKFNVLEVLGDGNFALVKKALRKDCGLDVAVKIIHKSNAKAEMLENEIFLMKMCDHENIVKLYEEFETAGEIYLIMEFITGGDLFDLISKHTRFEERLAALMIHDLANAINYLHNRCIVHRDLKPENVLVHYKSDGTLLLKLADFGLAKIVTDDLMFDICGTPTYVAPEIINGNGYGIEIDLWALGVILYILLCGFPPFRGDENDHPSLFKAIQTGVFEFTPPYWNEASDASKELIKKLIELKPEKRYNCIEVLCDPFVLSNVIEESSGDSEDFRAQVKNRLTMEKKVTTEHFKRIYFDYLE